MSYTPQSASLAGRVCAFFRQHSEEELSTRDIAQKFDAQLSSVDTLLASSIASHLLKRTKQGSATVYSAGPHLASSTAPAVPAPPPVPTIATSAFEQARKSSRRRAPPINVDEISIEKNVPLPTVRRAPAWDVLLERLTASTCSSPLPIEYRHSLKNAVDKWAKAKGGTFVIRPISDTHSARPEE